MRNETYAEERIESCEDLRYGKNKELTTLDESQQGKQLTNRVLNETELEEPKYNG